MRCLQKARKSLSSGATTQQRTHEQQRKRLTMRYSPYSYEHQAMDDFNNRQRLEYFLTRLFEAEEVWGINDGLEWVSFLKNGKVLLPLWPYESLAQDACDPMKKDLLPSAESLEDFLHFTLDELEQEGIMLELLPVKQQCGSEISPEQLKSILTGMIEAGEYTIEG